jgi:hypothetical protein
VANNYDYEKDDLTTERDVYNCLGKGFCTIR